MMTSIDELSIINRFKNMNIDQNNLAKRVKDDVDGIMREVEGVQSWEGRDRR